jgi:hypothetical protein
MKYKNLIQKASIIIFLVLFSFPRQVISQELGMSFSFFFPRNGYFSNPVSPFSLRGIGVHPTDFFSIESGFSLYRMSGMNVIQLPFETRDPLMGPFFSIMVPLQAVFELQAGSVVFRLKGGGFGFYNFDTRINYGNMDRALRNYYQWDVANSDLKYDNTIGFGYLVGGEIIFYFADKFGINFEVNYLSGGSNLNYRGFVTGGSMLDIIETENIEYKDARLDFTGWEITIGVLFDTKR